MIRIVWRSGLRFIFPPILCKFPKIFQGYIFCIIMDIVQSHPVLLTQRPGLYLYFRKGMLQLVDEGSFQGEFTDMGMFRDIHEFKYIGVFDNIFWGFISDLSVLRQHFSIPTQRNAFKQRSVSLTLEFSDRPGFRQALFCLKRPYHRRWRAVRHSGISFN